MKHTATQTEINYLLNRLQVYSTGDTTYTTVYLAVVHRHGITFFNRRYEFLASYGWQNFPNEFLDTHKNSIIQRVEDFNHMGVEGDGYWFDQACPPRREKKNCATLLKHGAE